MKRINILEIVLILIFIASGSGAIGFGQNIHHFPSLYGYNIGGDTGFVGGAIALGIVSATALIGIIWIEMARFKNKD